MMRPFLLLPAALILATPAWADPFTYSPKDCEVAIVFPEAPYIQNKCTGDATQNCTEVVTFTKTAAQQGSSINFRVTCHTDTAEELVKFTPPVMEETLKKMISDANLEPYNINSVEEDGFKKAVAVSVGKKDEKVDIYSGQIWIGKTSVFTMEAEMLGPKDAALEKTFADILKNTKAKNAPKTPPAEKKK